jgi:hypothetical protein
MNPDREKYFAKDFIELTYKAIDYIEENINSLAHIEHEDFKSINNRELVKKTIKHYTEAAFDDGLIGAQLITMATIIKKVIEDQKYQTLWNVNLNFFERDGKYYLDEN